MSVLAPRREADPIIAMLPRAVARCRRPCRGLWGALLSRPSRRSRIHGFPPPFSSRLAPSGDLGNATARLSNQDSTLRTRDPDTILCSAQFDPAHGFRVSRYYLERKATKSRPRRVDARDHLTGQTSPRKSNRTMLRSIDVICTQAEIRNAFLGPCRVGPSPDALEEHA